MSQLIGLIAFGYPYRYHERLEWSLSSPIPDGSTGLAQENRMKKFFFGGRKGEDEDSGKSPLPSSESAVFLTGNDQVDTAKIKLLMDTMAELISSMDPQRLLISIVDRCIRLADAERGILFLKEKGGDLSIRVARDAAGRNLEGAIQYSTKVVNNVFTNGKPVLLKVSTSETADLSQSIVDLKLRAVMCVTLSVRDEVLGVLYVDSRASEREFRRSDLKFFDALANAMAITIENSRLVSEYVKNERIKNSLEIARSIQRGLLPRNPEGLAGYDIAGRLEALEVTAGDYYDYIEIDSNHLGIVVGDVTGHGVGPAILMSSVRSLIRALLLKDFSIDAALEFLNQRLSEDMDEGMFVSLFLGVLDLKEKRLVYGNAGHCPPLILRGATGRFEELKRTGMALGIDPEIPFSPAQSVEMQPGDLLALFTDGIQEAQQKGKMFGIERLQDFLRKGKDLPAARQIDDVFDAVRDFVSGDDEGDDLTLSIVKIIR